MLYRPIPEAKESPIRSILSPHMTLEMQFFSGLFFSASATLAQNRDLIETLPEIMRSFYFFLQESSFINAIFNLYLVIGLTMMIDAGVVLREEWEPYLWAYMKVFILNTDSSAEDMTEE